MQSPIGTLAIETEDGCLNRLSFVTNTVSQHNAKTELEQFIYQELTSYFNNPKHKFSIPLKLSGNTPYRIRVWKALCKIEVGTTVSYSQLAKTLGSHPRAIGGACRTNPIPIIIPCHRVLSKNGQLCGYTGADGKHSLPTKAWLLKHEQSGIRSLLLKRTCSAFVMG